MARNLRRHPLQIAVNGGAALLVAVGMGMIYWKTGKDTAGIQDRMGALFFLQLYLSIISLSSLPVWRDNWLLFVRERASGTYGTVAYFVSTLVFDFGPMRVLPPLLFSALTYWMIGKEGEAYESDLSALAWVVGVDT